MPFTAYFTYVPSCNTNTTIDIVMKQIVFCSCKDICGADDWATGPRAPAKGEWISMRTTMTRKAFLGVAAALGAGAASVLIGCSQGSADDSARTTTPTKSLAGDIDGAVASVTLPRIEADGTSVEQGVGDALKAHLDMAPLTIEVDDSAKTLTADVALTDVRLASDYLNGVSPAGTSFYNMVNFDLKVRQLQDVLVTHEGFGVVDANGSAVDAAYVDELAGLLDQIVRIDPMTDLRYDYDAVYDSEAFADDETLGGTDVIATSKEGNVQVKFHIDSHGWWGYDLGAHDSITGLVMGYGEEYSSENQHDLTVQYGNFFVIKMESAGDGTLYMLDGTDLENPMIYVGADGKEALMVDVDFYGQNVICQRIKDVIGKGCESLNIYLTHRHGDHTLNLQRIIEDEELAAITTIYWPENEPHTMSEDGTNVDIIAPFGRIKTITDNETFSVAGHSFQFIEIPDEHTEAGGQLLDLENKILYSGDTLGAQIHLGGTTVMLSKVDSWVAALRKSVGFISEKGVRYIIGGHTPYLNNPAFASWVLTLVESARDQFAADPAWEGGLLVAENGTIIDGDRMGQMFEAGLTDREELVMASANFVNDTVEKEG